MRRFTALCTIGQQGKKRDDEEKKRFGKAASGVI